MHWVQLDFNKVNKTKQVVGAKSAHQFFFIKNCFKMWLAAQKAYSQLCQ